MSMRARNLLRSALLGAALLLSTAAFAGGNANQSYPYLGKVTGDSVRLRTGPSTNHAIASVVTKADSLTVIEAKNGWLKVEMPLSSQCWIAKEFTKVDGKVVTVTAKNVNLRIRPNTQNVPVGQVSEEKLTAILESGKVVEREGFIQVEPPKSATLWIVDDFVAFSKNVEAKALPVAGTIGHAAVVVRELSEAEKHAKALGEEVAVFKELELELAARLKREGDKELAEMQALMQQFAASSEQKNIRDAATAWVEKIGKIDATLKAAAANKQAVVEAEKKADVIRAEAEAKRAKLIEETRALLKKPEAKAVEAWIAKGYVGDTGKNAKIPASHALFDENGKVIFYIRWDFGDLNGMWQKFVGITGTQKTYDGWDKPVIIIKAAKVLPEERS